MPSNAPFGFRPMRHRSGGVPRQNEYPIATGYSTSIWTGDPVKAVTAGGIEAAAAGDRILGIFQGVQYVDASGNQVFQSYWPASTTATDIKATVMDDKNVSLRVQSGGTPTVADRFLLADHVTGTGSNYTGQSAAYLSGTMATGNAGFRILGLVDEPGNSGQYAHLEVILFEPEYGVDDPATPGV